MLRPLLGLWERDLERGLLRKGVGALTAGRTACADCRRTPLIGETIHRYEGDRVVCELCRGRHRSAPERSELVHHAEHGQTVRRREAMLSAAGGHG
jgi:hypothetical protein